MDNVSFHSEESVTKWKFVYKRRIAQERELVAEVLACQDVMDLGRCFDKLVKEFIVNISVECNISGSPEFHKVVVRGLLSSAYLSVKYALLNRIGAANWAPTKHASNLPIGFPCMISEIILSQHSDILSADESPSVKASPLTIDNMLLIGTHVPDVAGMTAKSHNGGASSSKPTETVLAELMEVSKTLQETITSFTIRKRNVDRFIKELTMGKGKVDDSTAAADEQEGDVSDTDDKPDVSTSSDF
ncbi:uncharacterized protein LOC130735143 [Lotus japonicus]|uniref:uncharacterized protein LOC130735143 n=1 Tax=Lotus japonicus TaxID=34305 RepID=UPI00258B3C20|nr:uncharacterized protein LOC130735143 [Lotus japonicus]